MSYHQPPCSGCQHPYYPSSPPANGSDSMLLGSMLGELKTGQHHIVSALGQQTGVLHRIHDRLEENAKLMAHLPEAATSSDQVETTLDDRLRTLREILKTLVPLALLAAIIMGKMTLLEAWPLIRQSLGVAG